MSSYQKCGFICFGVAHLVLGVLAILINSLGISQLVKAHSLGGVGIWGGAFFLAAGVAGIIAGLIPEKSSYVVFLVLSLLSTLLGLLVAVSAGIGAYVDKNGCLDGTDSCYTKWYLQGYDDEPKRPQRVAVNSSVFVVGLIEFFVALAASIFAIFALKNGVNGGNRRRQENPEKSVPGIPLAPRAISISSTSLSKSNQKETHSGRSRTTPERKYVPGLPFSEHQLEIAQIPADDITGRASLSPESIMSRELRSSLSRSSSLEESVNLHENWQPNSSTLLSEGLALQDFNKKVKVPKISMNPSGGKEAAYAAPSGEGRNSSKPEKRNTRRSPQSSDDEVFAPVVPPVNKIFRPITDNTTNSSPADSTGRNSAGLSSNYSNKTYGQNFGKKTLPAPQPQYPQVDEANYPTSEGYYYPHLTPHIPGQVQHRPAPRRPPGYVPPNTNHWTVHRYYHFPSGNQ